jgi:hypothetical protein
VIPPTVVIVDKGFDKRLQLYLSDQFFRFPNAIHRGFGDRKAASVGDVTTDFTGGPPRIQQGNLKDLVLFDGQNLVPVPSLPLICTQSRLKRNRLLTSMVLI